MSDRNPLWDTVYEAFSWHQHHLPDQNPQMALDRVAAKCIRLSFNPDNCEVHEEVLALDDLKRLTRYSEDDAVPHKPDKEPIIVLVHNGQRFVIDGRRRVTKWMTEGLDKPRRALIITPRE